MPLNLYEEAGLRLHYFLHFYLWPFPITFRPDFQKMRVTKPYLKWLPFVFMTVYMTMFGISCISVTIYYMCINQKPYFGRENGVILCIFGSCACAMVIVIIKGIRMTTDGVLFINNWVNISQSFFEGIRKNLI